jgi:hypothetical protein
MIWSRELRVPNSSSAIIYAAGFAHLKNRFDRQFLASSSIGFIAKNFLQQHFTRSQCLDVIQHYQLQKTFARVKKLINMTFTLIQKDFIVTKNCSLCNVPDIFDMFESFGEYFDSQFLSSLQNFYLLLLTFILFVEKPCPPINSHLVFICW